MFLKWVQNWYKINVPKDNISANFCLPFNQNYLITGFHGRCPSQTETNWMDELDSKLRNLEELEAARAKEAWEKHVVSTHCQ